MSGPARPDRDAHRGLLSDLLWLFWPLFWPYGISSVLATVLALYRTRTPKSPYWLREAHLALPGDPLTRSRAGLPPTGPLGP